MCLYLAAKIPKEWSHSYRQCLSYLFGLNDKFQMFEEMPEPNFPSPNTNIRYQYYWLYHNLLFSITLSTALNFITLDKDRLRICSKLILIYIM